MSTRLPKIVTRCHGSERYPETALFGGVGEPGWSCYALYMDQYPQAGPQITASGSNAITMVAARAEAEAVTLVWFLYADHGGIIRGKSAAGARLPAGLLESARLDPPLFTPATKAETGHDENITVARLHEALGAELAERLRTASLALYGAARDRAAEHGIIIADTKFEFGTSDGKRTPIDEAPPPDSSRYWDAAKSRGGTTPPSFDKQYVRDFLIKNGWNREPPAPRLPPLVVEGTSQRYRECYKRIVGEDVPE